MDVVYVIGTGSKWDNNELRYSLRSICRYGIGLGRVIIVGDKLPEFVNPARVTFIKYADKPGGSPARNVYSKIAQIFYQTNLDKFLLSSDDHFFIKETIFEYGHYPILYKGLAMPMPGEKGIGDKRYSQTMFDTRRFMEAADLSLKYYEGHTNKLYTREAWEHLQSLRESSYSLYGKYGSWFLKAMKETEYGISTNAPMAAMHMLLHPNYPCRYRKDIKLRHLNTPEDWKLLEDANSFSIYDSAIHTGVEEFLQHFFPVPCIFER